MRDSYICIKCKSIPRERALMYCVEKFFPDWRELTIHESSPCERGASLRFKREAKYYIPSQYYPDRKLGEYHGSFRNENLEYLTFEDNSIDLHISQDVFEHIINPEEAFREVARTLKPGGAHIFTTPLVNKTKPTEWCIKRDQNGNLIQMVFPAEYHGNPISQEGSLVVAHWGYDITSFIYESCGLFTEMVYLDIIYYGIRADLIEVLITRKPP